MLSTTPVLTVVRTVDDPPFVDRVTDKVRALAAVKPALVRLLEWQLDEELEQHAHDIDGSSSRPAEWACASL